MTWPLVPLGDVVSISKGKKPEVISEVEYDSFHRLIQIDDLRAGAIPKFVQKAAGEVLADPSDVVIAWDGANAATSSYGLAGAIGSTLARLRPVEVNSISTPFLGRFIQSNQKFLRSKTTGATIPHLDGKVLRALKVPLPPMAEQVRIAGILDLADEVRAKRRAALALLDTLPQSLFHQMFGDPSNYGHQIKFGDAVGLTGGRNLVADDADFNSAFRVLKISAVTSGQFKSYESKPLPPEYVPPATHLVQPGNLLMSRANTTELVGAVALVNKTPNNLALPDKVWRFDWKVPAESIFWQAMMSTPSIRRRIGQLSSGTGGSMKNISKGKLNSMLVPDVPLELQEEFARRVEAINAQRELLEQALAKDEELFASLQSRAFSGEL